MSPLTICLIIFALTVAGYCSGLWSLATVSMLSMFALTVTGCMSAKDALGYFGNNNVVMIGAMAIVAAGFNRTQFCTNLANSISKIAKGNLTMLMVGYGILSMLLSQFIQSPVIVFGIVGPMAMASAESMNIKPSKIIFPIGLITLITCCTLPVGAGATVPAELNGYIESYGYTAHMVGQLDPFIGRAPMLIVGLLYGIFVAPKFAPDEPIVQTSAAVKKAAAKEPLKPFAEWAGVIIFFGDALALIFASKLGLATWQICMIGAILMVVCGTLKPKEATGALNLELLLLIAGSLAMAGALAGTGAGEVIGGIVAKVVMSFGGNNYLIGLIFFVVPFILTQVMSNRGTMLIFHPIAIATAEVLGGNPVGLMILVQAAALTAFMTPMATASVPQLMDMGGYDQPSLFKQSWLIGIIATIVSVLWVMTFFPVL